MSNSVPAEIRIEIEDSIYSKYMQASDEAFKCNSEDDLVAIIHRVNDDRIRFLNGNLYFRKNLIKEKGEIVVDDNGIERDLSRENLLFQCKFCANFFAFEAEERQEKLTQAYAKLSLKRISSIDIARAIGEGPKRGPKKDWSKIIAYVEDVKHLKNQGVELKNALELMAKKYEFEADKWEQVSKSVRGHISDKNRALRNNQKPN